MRKETPKAAVREATCGTADGGPASWRRSPGTTLRPVWVSTGMIAAQLDDTVTSAPARLRATAIASGRAMCDVGQDVVGRRVRFDE